ncbi:sensor histidine kinase [Labrys monachus]|uniref:histidine kinase n=1 Tax=Labrys monachus TaxID=217067 RepID=A0ABU0F8N9_9HYPH|nr:sensor histidine kinase [Labrys monachus]MDQ0390950.1 two-component sensor histidine kinase [Labrys monachus]
MVVSNLAYAVIATADTPFHRTDKGAGPIRPAIALCEHEPAMRGVTGDRLEASIGRDSAVLLQKTDPAERNDILAREAEHRLLNGLQLMTSLLSMQSRTTESAEAASELVIAANRVNTLVRIHRHLHTLDHTETVEFKPFLEKLCQDLFGLVSAQFPERSLALDAAELRIPTAKAIPLAFVASELITNSIKHAKGRIAVSLQASAGKGCALCVSDDGPGLPPGFDPATARGLGMKLISAFTRQLGGELQFGRGDRDRGARLTVLFQPEDVQS